MCFLHSMLVPFVQPLSFHCTYIRLKSMYVSPVCILTSTSIVILLLVFDLSLMPFDIFWTPEAVQLSTLFSFDLHEPGNYFHGTFDSVTSLWSLGSTYTCIQLEIPGPQQKASAAHELKPLSRNSFVSGTTRPDLCVR